MTDPDPAGKVFRHAQREARVVLVVWALALVWTLGVCYLWGYEHDQSSWAVQSGMARPRSAADLTLFLGMPDWVWLGIVLPWFLCSAFTAGFCLGMTDDPLGPERVENAHGH